MKRQQQNALLSAKGFSCYLTFKAQIQSFGEIVEILIKWAGKLQLSFDDDDDSDYDYSDYDYSDDIVMMIKK